MISEAFNSDSAKSTCPWCGESGTGYEHNSTDPARSYYFYTTALCDWRSDRDKPVPALLIFQGDRCRRDSIHRGRTQLDSLVCHQLLHGVGESGFELLVRNLPFDVTRDHGVRIRVQNSPFQGGTRTVRLPR